jgi:hypothetical protein
VLGDLLAQLGCKLCPICPMTDIAASRTPSGSMVTENKH